MHFLEDYIKNSDLKQGSIASHQVVACFMKTCWGILHLYVIFPPCRPSSKKIIKGNNKFQCLHTETFQSLHESIVPKFNNGLPLTSFTSSIILKTALLTLTMTLIIFSARICAVAFFGREKLKSFNNLELEYFYFRDFRDQISNIETFRD